MRRQHLFEDSHRDIMGCKNKNHLKARLWVKFDGEKGLDYGGVSRLVGGLDYGGVSRLAVKTAISDHFNELSNQMAKYFFENLLWVFLVIEPI